MYNMMMDQVPDSLSGMMSLRYIPSFNRCLMKTIYQVRMQCVQKESGLLEYLTAKEEKDVMICGIMTDFCINATVEAGFEHGLHMIVPAYANSTQDNEYMTREQAYHYYNEFLWPERYADCVPMDRALELLKK